eukprot:ANDGO_04584.mRNA.1 tRNA-dihydrouridine(20) synthase
MRSGDLGSEEGERGSNGGDEGRCGRGRELDYRNKVMLAPMVRFGYLHHRLLAREYGCDVCYSEEIIDKKVIRSTVERDASSGVVHFRTPSNNVEIEGDVDCFVAWPERERGGCVMQLGTGDPELAVQAGRKVQEYVDGIDVNMGCPKKFSTQMGSGAVLLSHPEVAESILHHLVRAVDVPVTCKVRLLENKTLEQSIDFYKRMERTGIKALTVHCRFPSQKPRHRGNWAVFREIKRHLSIPLIANGDIYTWDDMEKVVADSGCDSVMLARGALQNLSIFKPNKYRHSVGGRLGNVKEWFSAMPAEFLPDHPLHVARRLIDENIKWKAGIANCKYVLGKAMERQHCIWQLLQTFPSHSMEAIVQLWSPENDHRWTGNPPAPGHPHPSSSSSLAAAAAAAAGNASPNDAERLAAKSQRDSGDAGGEVLDAVPDAKRPRRDANVVNSE